MKESVRAARDEIAHNRSVAALKRLAGEDDPNIKDLEDLRTRRLPASVSSMMEREIMAGILEGLAAGGEPPTAEERQRVAKFAANLAETDPGGGSGQEEPPVPSAVLDGDTYALLSESGYDTHEAIAGASHEQLLDIKGIGPAKLEEIREKVG